MSKTERMQAEMLKEDFKSTHFLLGPTELVFSHRRGASIGNHCNRSQQVPDVVQRPAVGCNSIAIVHL